MLVEQDLFGNVRDKIKRAIEIVQMYEPKDEPFILAYSGGKDSVVTKKICDLAGVRYEATYNVTTVDPAELVRFIIRQFEGVIYNYCDDSQKYFRVNDGRLVKADADDMPANVITFNIPKYNMRELILKNLIPPSRLARYCCAELKEKANPYRIVITGSRKHESLNRKMNSGDVVIFDGKVGANVATENNVNFTKTNRGGWYSTSTTEIQGEW